MTLLHIYQSHHTAEYFLQLRKYKLCWLSLESVTFCEILMSPHNLNNSWHPFHHFNPPILIFILIRNRKYWERDHPRIFSPLLQIFFIDYYDTHFWIIQTGHAVAFKWIFNTWHFPYKSQETHFFFLLCTLQLTKI